MLFAAAVLDTVTRHSEQLHNTHLEDAVMLAMLCLAFATTVSQSSDQLLVDVSVIYDVVVAEL